MVSPQIKTFELLPDNVPAARLTHIALYGMLDDETLNIDERARLDQLTAFTRDFLRAAIERSLSGGAIEADPSFVTLVTDPESTGVFATQEELDNDPVKFRRAQLEMLAREPILVDASRPDLNITKIFAGDEATLVQRALDRLAASSDEYSRQEVTDYKKAQLAREELAQIDQMAESVKIPVQRSELDIFVKSE